MKQYIGFARDHSGSMAKNKKEAKADYNAQINAIREESIKHQLDTIIFTTKFGVRNGIEREAVNSTVHLLQPLTDYETSYMTPMYDAIGDLITMMKSLPDYGQPGVAFMVNVFTDGLENASKSWNLYKLREEIRKLHQTDVWTFVFRTPPGYNSQIAALGIPPGNILEWGSTPEELEKSTDQVVASYSRFFEDRSKGVTSSKKFFSDLSGVSSRQIRDNLKNITSEAEVWDVSKYSNTSEIRTYVEGKIGSYLKGAAFYELMKPETIQDNKKIILRNKRSQALWAGEKARKFLGLPDLGNVRVRPGDHGDYDIFVQSTSVNRKLVGGTTLVYWPGAVR